MVSPVINMPSGKHSGVSGMDTQLFCQHSGETPLRGGYAQSLTSANNNDSTWYASWPSFVDPIARVRQIAWPNSAWTQGYANPFAVGLECAGYAHFSEADWLTAAGRKQLENLAHEWCYYLELEEQAGNEIPLRWLSNSQVRAVMNGDRSIKGFCTHAQIDPGSRSDPGPNFPYDRLMNRIKQLRGGHIDVASGTTDWFDMASEADLRRIIQDELRENNEHSAFATQAYKGLHPEDGDPDSWNYQRTTPDRVWTREIATVNSLGEDASYQAQTYIRVDNKNLWEVKGDVKTLLAQQEVMLAAIETLSNAKGIDPAPILAAIEATADKAVERLDSAWDEVMEGTELQVVAVQKEEAAAEAAAEEEAA